MGPLDLQVHDNVVDQIAGDMEAATLSLPFNAFTHVNALFTIAHSAVFTFRLLRYISRKMFSESLLSSLYIMTP